MDGSAPLSHTEQNARTHPSNSYHNQPTCVQVLCTVRAFPTHAYDHPLTPAPPNTAAFGCPSALTMDCHRISTSEDKEHPGRANTLLDVALNGGLTDMQHTGFHHGAD